MGVFTRPDSPYWWIYLETAKQKERTAIKVGTTTAQRQDSKRLALDRYHQRMNELAARLYKLPSARPAIRFSKYAETYQADVIAHHKGAEREREILKVLTYYFGEDLLSLIDPERVRVYITARRLKVSARTINREIDLLKAMLRDAVPKYLDASPIVGLKRLPVIPPKRRLLMPAEERRLLKHLDRTDRAIVLMGLDTLCRLGDILDLRREDDHGRTLFIREPKDPSQSRSYVVPVSTRLRAALDAVPKPKIESPYYFPTRRRAVTDRDRRSVIRKVLRLACKAANIPYGRAKGGITFHWATRRTGATRMIQRKVDLKTVQAIGHWRTADVVLDIYAETNPQAARAAVELVGSFPRRGKTRGR